MTSSCQEIQHSDVLGVRETTHFGCGFERYIIVQFWLCEIQFSCGCKRYSKALLWLKKINTVHFSCGCLIQYSGIVLDV